MQINKSDRNDAVVASWRAQPLRRLDLGQGVG